MKRGICYLLLLLIIFSITFISTAEEKGQKIDVKVLKELEKSESVRVMIKYSENNQKGLFSQKDSIVSQEKIMHQFKDKFSATLTEEEILMLKDNPEIESIEIVGKKFPLLLDSIPQINANKTWKVQLDNINLTGIKETICILDTGVNFDHPDLLGQNASCPLDCTGTSCAYNCSLKDYHGHGTHVAGIAASSINKPGVARGANLISLKVCNETGCFDDDIESAIEWCTDNKEQYNVSVISMSLGDCSAHDTYCNDDYLANSINQATNNNITVVAAAGNCDETDCPGISCTEGISSPACVETVVPVGGVDDSDNMDHYQRGEILELLAPGVGVSAPDNSGSGYITYSGTSMAAPHVSGLIAILKQYKKLESNNILSINEIKTSLFESGKKINDTNYTNKNYSRIDAYSTILYLDEQAPNITHMFPENNSLRKPQNQSFTCNATDLLQFANLTIEIYNSTSLVKNISTTQNSLTTYINTTLGENYNWTCTAKDNNSNTESKNYFLSTLPIRTEIIAPTNNIYTNQNTTNFNCSAETTKELSNLTINIYKNNLLIYNRTHSLTGKNNYTVFEYNLENETSYKYNFLAINNNSEQSQTPNYTITYDKTSPKINLTSPNNNTRTQTKTHTFKYNQTEINPNYCNLTINKEIQNSFTKTLPDETYYWNITCTDLANNTNNSNTYKLTIYTEETSSGGGSSSSSSTTIPIEETKKEIEITQKEIEKGIIKEMNKNDGIKFKVKNQSHKLTINTINTDKINITIKSNPFSLILYKHKIKKINFDNDKTYDLELMLLSTQDEKVQIFFQEINETIPIKQLFQEPKNETEIKEELPKTDSFVQKTILFFKKIISYFKKIKLF